MLDVEKKEGGPYSKRFCRFVLTFEAFIAFWSHKNWGDRQRVREGGGPRPKVWPSQKAKNASNAPLLMESYNRTFAL